MKTRSARLWFLVVTAAGIAALIDTAGCAEWQHGVRLHGITFERARITDRGLVIGYLAADTRIRGRPCRAGWVHLHPNGVPAGFTAAEEIPIASWKILAGTWVFQNPEGIVTVCAFPHDVAIQGHLCRGTGGPKGTQTAFYPSGALRQFFPPETVDVDGIPCSASRFRSGVELYENGRLRSATLADDHLVAGRMQKRGQRVEFAPDGTLERP